MARLEFEFIGLDQNFRSSASNVLKDIEKIKSAFRDVGKGVSGDALKAVLGSQKVALAEAKVEAFKLAQAHKNELATALNESKKGFIDAKTAIQEYNLEQKKLKDTQRTNSQGAYSNLSKELNQMRNEAKNLGAQMILLDKAGMSNSATFNTLQNRFDLAQKEALELDQAIKKLDSSVGLNQRNVGNYASGLSGYQQAQSGANGVAMEFNRIIQDAPYGMMGIGNNIQQLASNWQVYTQQVRAAAVANGQTVTSMTLVKGALSTIISPANLVTLAIAGITSGWVMYQQYQQKANKEMKDSEKGMKSYAETLDGISRMQLEGSQSAQKELVNLQLLKKVYDDNSTSQKKRKEAYNSIMDLYGKYFGEMSKEEQKVFNLEKGYQKLATTILATAKARAAENLIMKNQEKALENDMKRINLRNELIKKEAEYQRIQKATSQADTRFGGGSAIADVRNNAWQELNKARQAYFDNVNANKGILKENNALSAEAVKLMQNEANVSDNTAQAIAKETKERQKRNKEVNAYLELLKELNSISGLSSVDYATLGQVGIDLEVGKVQAELDVVTRQVLEFQEKVLKNASLSEQQRADLIAKSQIDLEIITGRHLANMEGLQKTYMERLEKALEVRAVKTTPDGFDIPETENPQWKKDLEKNAKELTRALRSELNKIINMLPELSGGFSKIFSDLTDGIGDIFKRNLVNKLSEMLTEKMKDLDESTQKIGGALAIAGQTLKGLFKNTSIVGQGLGGGLSGASAGLGIGSMLKDTLGKNGGLIGAAIGGVVGLLGGIFGAKKQRKQEELQRKQLEEQKKANALLERMNALAYTSSIIGGMTKSGLVSGVNRNAFGDVVFRIDGRDLVATVNNNNRLNGR